MNWFSRIQDNKYFQSKKIEVKISGPEMGLGVFATENIENGELIERCPLIQLSWRSRYLFEPQLSNYCYTNKGECDCEECQTHGYHYFMVLGYGMLYNHQDNPNTRWEFNYTNLIGDVIAIENIKKGDEIFVHYGDGYFKNRKKYIKKEKD